MREIRIYQSGPYLSGQVLELSPEAGQHVSLVLRMHEGECLTLFNGENQEFQCTIHAVKKKQVVVLVGAAKSVSRESNLSIHLAQAISKGDRMEFVMQKSVELGVSSITPLITDRCVVKLDKERMTKKLHQWQAIAIAACEQSGRNTIPTVHQPVSLERFVQESQAKLKLILDPETDKTWRDYPVIKPDIALIIGPEGGLSTEEIKLACHHGFLSLSLGPRILRTETAALSALSVLQAVGGDL